MKCGVAENPAYDVVHDQGSADDRPEPDYNMKIKSVDTLWNMVCVPL